MKTVQIFTDGACSGNPGPGGWGAILRYGTAEKELSGGAAETTNNRMELTGVISALAALKEPCQVLLTTDSKYVVDSITKGWVYGWKKRGWVKSDKKPALNVDLWEQLLSATKSLSTGSKDTPAIRRTSAATSWQSCSGTSTPNKTAHCIHTKSPAGKGRAFRYIGVKMKK